MMWWTLSALAAPAVIEPERCAAAIAYNAAHGGVSLLVRVDDRVVCEDHPGGRDVAYELASGTKSFSGLLAVALVQRGMLDLDEPISDTLTEWADDPRKATITVRQLLSLTSGLESRPLRETWAQAIEESTFAEPGTRFRYGGAPFQVFGALVERKTGRDPVSLLTEWVLEPIGLEVHSWRRTGDGHPILPHGAKLTAEEWAKVGELVAHHGRWGDEQVLRSDLLDQLFVGSDAASFYGISWWLFRAGGSDVITNSLAARHLPTSAEPAIPRDLVMAAGMGDQRLYVSADQHLVVVRQTDQTLGALVSRSGWSDTEFLKVLLRE